MKKFKYKGSNGSFYYNNILGPFCEFLVNNFIPRSIS